MATVTSSAVGFLRSCLQYSRHRQQKPKGKLTANKPLPDTDTQTHMLHPHTEIQTDKCHTHTLRENTHYTERHSTYTLQTYRHYRDTAYVCAHRHGEVGEETRTTETLHTPHIQRHHTHTHRHRMLCKRQNCILLERKVDRTSEP